MDEGEVWGGKGRKEKEKERENESEGNRKRTAENSVEVFIVEQMTLIDSVEVSLSL